jgi:hypothetical protein
VYPIQYDIGCPVATALADILVDLGII